MTKKNYAMKKYLETLFDEKGIDRESHIEFENENGFNLIPYQCIIELICTQDIGIQNKVKIELTKLDLVNGDIKQYFKRIAEGMEIILARGI